MNERKSELDEYDEFSPIKLDYLNPTNLHKFIKIFFFYNI